MDQEKKAETRDWRETLFLPQTSFPMKAGLPTREPQFLERWEKIGLYKKLRKDAKGRKKFVLHDGPPYANGHLHVGHALNKILKDIVVRSQQMMGRDANYVPGWDCHGLPIEWKVEEQYRAKQKNKDDVPINEFRSECRDFATKWIDVQREEFKRLGVTGDWENPYLTMDFEAEAIIAEEIMKFAMNGSLYQGSKPVMWSVVEKTALAEAEVEYHEHVSPTIFVRFAIEQGPENLKDASVVIWTTTPWTIPGNRAIAYSSRITYGLYEVTDAPDDNWAKVGDKFVLADARAHVLKDAARIESWKRIDEVDPAGLVAAHPFKGKGFDFPVRLYAGDFVTDDAGTGFVHIAPSHGADDFGLYLTNQRSFEADGIDQVPHTVREDGYYYEDMPIFGGAEPKRVINDKGKFADANDAVMEELMSVGSLVARGRLRHDYPHSWRSKAPVIFRNTAQWFAAMDKPIKVKGQKKEQSIRKMAMDALKKTTFVPPTGEARLTAMVKDRPDWVLSRQRAWGVPITVFVHKKTGEVIPNAEFKGSKELMGRIFKAFKKQGADAWFKRGSRSKFLKDLVDNPADWEQVMDILDVWFDSGSTHAFVLEKRKDLDSPADVYLEGSDQHRGWFQSSLLESCGTRGRAPYGTVLTHGFILDEKGEEKMSKSKGNTLSPQDVSKQNGAEILRLWVSSSDYNHDIRFGPGLVQANTDSYRKLRNTLRFLLGNLHHYDEKLKVKPKQMPELERYMLHRLWELNDQVRKGYEAYDFKRVFSALFNFAVVDLSAFYFDIRKDALYCDPHDSVTRRACLTVLDEVFHCLTAWLAPIMCFTMEEAWLARFPKEKGSVHLRQFPKITKSWADDDVAEKWQKIRQVRRVVTGALEIERREKRIGSSLEAAPVVYVKQKALRDVFEELDLAEICITSQAVLKSGGGPEEAFRLDDVDGVCVVPALAEGEKCQRSWKILPDVGSDADYPELSARDAAAVRQFDGVTRK